MRLSVRGREVGVDEAVSPVLGRDGEAEQAALAGAGVDARTRITTRLRRPSGEMRRMRPVVRSLTSASPPGRKATPHGTWSPVTIVRAALAPALSRASEPQATTSETTRSRMTGRRSIAANVGSRCWTLGWQLPRLRATRVYFRFYPIAASPDRVGPGPVEHVPQVAKARVAEVRPARPGLPPIQKNVELCLDPLIGPARLRRRRGWTNAVTFHPLVAGAAVVQGVFEVQQVGVAELRPPRPRRSAVQEPVEFGPDRLVSPACPPLASLQL